MKVVKLKIPGDKSISHRAIIFASLSNGGVFEFSNFLMSEDCLHTIECFRQMGVKIEVGHDKVKVCGVGFNGLKQPRNPLYVGNSGTSIRLLTGILAGQSFDSVITGDSSIEKRPMKRVIDPLRQMGAKISGDDLGDNIYPPLRIAGGQQLVGIDYKMPVASAQVDSCIRFASLYAKGSMCIDKQCMAYRDHTEKMLERMSWVQTQDSLNDTVCNFKIPSDISSAAFFLVAGAIVPNLNIELENINLNPTRVGILHVLKEMGAKLEVVDTPWDLEIEGNISIQRSELTGITIGKPLIPTLIDEIPIIALAASLAKGTTIIKDAAELKVKESDRIHTVATELNRIGGHVIEQPDGMIIHGVDKLSGSACKSYGDHRIAMMLKIANLVSDDEISVDDEKCIRTSFPEFNELIGELVR